jgi:hypothetical protein
MGGFKARLTLARPRLKPIESLTIREHPSTSE